MLFARLPKKKLGPFTYISRITDKVTMDENFIIYLVKLFICSLRKDSDFLLFTMLCM